MRSEVLLMSLAQLEDDGRLVNMAIRMCVVSEGI